MRFHRRVCERALNEAHARIEVAYWRFCRMAKAKPPVLVEPEAYQVRTLSKALLMMARCPNMSGNVRSAL